MEKDLLEFDLRVTEDEIAVLINCDLPSEGDDFGPLLEQVTGKMVELGIKDPPDKETLEKQLREVGKQGSRLKDVVLMEGKPAIPSQDGWVEWTGDYFKPGFEIDEETGAIDYRCRAAKVTVTEGQLLGKVIPAKMGEEGIDVFGNILKVEEPSEAMIHEGTNVRFEREDGAFYAKSNGRIRLINSILSVDPIYTVEGSVGLESGNIHHNGAVVIQKDVLEGSTIEAEGDIEVYGVLEKAKVKTNGNLMVHGGITGIEDHDFSVAGELNAKFVLDSNIRVSGDIVVEREIVNSNIRTRGVVKIPRGRIVGGEVIALRGITAGQVGSRAYVPTKLTTGVDYALPGKIRVVRREIKEIEKKKDTLKSIVTTLLLRRSYLSPKEKDNIEKLNSELSAMDKTIQKLYAEIDSYRQESRSLAVQQILLPRMLYSETILAIGYETIKIVEDTSGPMRVTMSEEEITLS